MDLRDEPLHGKALDELVAYRLGILEKEVQTLKADRKNALIWGIIVLGGTVISLVSYIYHIGRVGT